jgi:hypothetical protein
MASYDRLDWHLESAIEAGQPEEHAFTHIGLYLRWLIEHGLHDPAVIPPEHAAAVLAGEMTGSDLADVIDTKLGSFVMTPEGAAFSDACYDRYLATYEEAFAPEPSYGVPDDQASYDRIAPRIDALFADWVASGRPRPAKDVDDEPDGLTDGSVVELDREFSQEDLQTATRRIVDELGGFATLPDGTVIAGTAPPGWEEERQRAIHGRVDLESLIPPELTDPPMDVTSSTGTTYGSSLLNRALRRLGVKPKDVSVVDGMGRRGDATVTVSAYVVPGVGAAVLEAEFGTVVYKPGRGPWATTRLGGRDVWSSAGPEFTNVWWAADGLVWHLSTTGHISTLDEVVARVR